MNRLLAADFARLKKNKLFLAGMIFMLGFGIFMETMNYISLKQYDIQGAVTDVLFIYPFAECIFSSAFISLFVGAEYSSGTIRNKLIAGHTRFSIYFSLLTVSAGAGILLCLIFLAGAFAVGIPLYGLDLVNVGTMTASILFSFVLSLAFSALWTLTAMLCQNRAFTAVINIFAVFFLLSASTYISARLDEPETYPNYVYTDDESRGIELSGTVPNPNYLRGTERQVYEFLDEFLPTGQVFELASYEDHKALLPRFTGYSAGITLAATAAGIFVFRRKDIK